MAFEIVNLVGAFFVISIFSIAFKDNYFYKFAERTFIGITLGVTITVSVNTIINNGINPILKGNYLTIIAIVLGLLLLTRFSKSYSYLSRYPIALIAGLGLAVWARTSVQAQIIESIRPVMAAPIISTNIPASIGALYAWIGIIAGLSYFIFSTGGIPNQVKPINDILGKIGRYVLMIYMGVAYSATLMGRESMLLERVLFVLRAFGLAK